MLTVNSNAQIFTKKQISIDYQEENKNGSVLLEDFKPKSGNDYAADEEFGVEYVELAKLMKEAANLHLLEDKKFWEEHGEEAKKVKRLLKVKQDKNKKAKEQRELKKEEKIKLRQVIASNHESSVTDMLLARESEEKLEDILNRLNSNQARNFDITKNQYLQLDFFRKNISGNLYITKQDLKFRQKMYSAKATTEEILADVQSSFKTTNNLSIAFSTYKYTAKARRENEVHSIKFMVLDIDSLEKSVEEIRDEFRVKNIPNPSLMIKSGNGYHVLFTLKSELVLDYNSKNSVNRKRIFKKANELLAESVEHADLSFVNLTKSIRLADTKNIKKSGTTQTELIELSDTSYNYFEDFNYKKAIDEVNKDDAKNKLMANEENKISNATKNYKVKNTQLNIDYISDIKELIMQIQNNPKFSEWNNSTEGVRNFLLFNVSQAAFYELRNVNQMLTESLKEDEINAIAKSTKKDYEENKITKPMYFPKLIATVFKMLNKKYNADLSFKDEDIYIQFKLLKNSEHVKSIRKNIFKLEEKYYKSCKKSINELKKYNTIYFVKNYKSKNTSRFKTKKKLYLKLEELTHLNSKTIKKWESENQLFIDILDSTLKASEMRNELLKEVIENRTYLNRKEKAKLRELVQIDFELTVLVRKDIESTNLKSFILKRFNDSIIRLENLLKIA